MLADDTRKHIESLFASDDWHTAFLEARSAFLADPDPKFVTILNKWMKTEKEHVAALCQTKQNIAVLASFTVEPLIPYLSVLGFAHEIEMEIFTGMYDQVKQQLIDPGSDFYRQDCKHVFVFVRLEDWFEDTIRSFNSLSGTAENEFFTEVSQVFALMIETFANHSKGKMFLSELTPYRFLPVRLSSESPKRLEAFYERLNRYLSEELKKSKCGFLLNMANWIADQGRTHVFDNRVDWIGRMPFSQSGLFSLAQRSVHALKSSLSLSRKCIVLDLDNTLWGGVLGEDGVEGIQIGPDYPGTVYRDLQAYLLALYHQGYVLVVCSKNDEAEVRDCLKNHPHQILRDQHYAAIAANWEEKSVNLQKISKDIRISLDHMIFLDDNPVEIEKMKQLCPEVLSLQLPSPPHGFQKIIESPLEIGRLTLTDADKTRGEQYSIERKRHEIGTKYATFGDYLRDLKQVLTLTINDPFQIKRLAQLTQRTNQFNMRTQRFDETEIEGLMNSGNDFIFSVASKDRLGDSGVVGMAHAKEGDDSWLLENYLMSCRILGRKIEDEFLAAIKKRVFDRGGKKLRAGYQETKKNRPFRNFYLDHGFREIKGPVNNGVIWFECDLSAESTDSESMCEIVWKDIDEDD